MPPRTPICLGAARRETTCVVRGAARGGARDARGGRSARDAENVDRVVGGDEPSVEQQGLGINVDEGRETVPVVAFEFIRDLESIFEPMGINGELRTMFAIYRLHGGARDWWENVHRSLVATGQTPVEMELAECRASGEKRGRQDVFRTSGQINSEFQEHPSQRSRFSQNQFGTPAANSRFSFDGSMPRPFNRMEGSLRSYRDRVASVRDGIEGGRGGRFRGRGNPGRGAESSQSGAVAGTTQGGVGTG
ncbi:hypothetical protein LIER_18463 [Lithospermum erythrorhizon]|uniref:Retrotransposon gag domain-containing protein n=1 Tax=Lithospermum erythrorhizon TaxID=34254 RepID=A0AAV3QE32_LITER